VTPIWSRSCLSKLRSFLRLSLHLKALTLEAFFLVILARLLVLLLPFRSIHPFLGRLGVETTPDPQTLPRDTQTIAAVQRVLKTTSRNLPRVSNCLARAIAGQRMLIRRGIPATLYLGAHLDQRDLTAHAWLRAGDVYLTGGRERHKFTPVAWYGG
jgi:hypothetical protein